MSAAPSLEVGCVEGTKVEVEGESEGKAEGNRSNDFSGDYEHVYGWRVWGWSVQRWETQTVPTQTCYGDGDDPEGVLENRKF